MSITYIKGLCTNRILFWRMKCSSYGNQFMAVLLIHAFKLSPWTFGTSFLLHFIPIQSGGISMLLTYFIAFQCYHWLEMFSYIKQMCHACPGCAFSNPLWSPSSDLVYHFPMKAPFRVLFADAYSAGKQSDFEGSKVYLLVSDGMTGFSVMKPIQHPNSTTFASGIMKVQLRFGFCHTIVLDKDSNFLEHSRRPSTYFGFIVTCSRGGITILC